MIYRENLNTKPCIFSISLDLSCRIPWIKIIITLSRKSQVYFFFVGFVMLHTLNKNYHLSIWKISIQSPIYFFYFIAFVMPWIKIIIALPGKIHEIWVKVCSRIISIFRIAFFKLHDIAAKGVKRIIQPYFFNSINLSNQEIHKDIVYFIYLKSVKQQKRDFHCLILITL